MIKYLIIIPFLLISSCGSKELYIRLKNESRYDMKNIKVNYCGEIIKYNNLKINEFSKYKKIKKAYSYSYIEWDALGKKRYVQPEDFMGEKLLEKGIYSYIIKSVEGDDIYYIIELKKEKSITSQSS